MVVYDWSYKIPTKASDVVFAMKSAFDVLYSLKNNKDIPDYMFFILFW